MGRSEKYKYITLNCNEKYEGQLNPTINKKVLDYTNATFIDDYVHFGGHEVVYNCWGNQPAIVAWMKANNISDYHALSIYFRQKQKKLWRTISTKKKIIYWVNEDINIPMDNEDIIQWWGVSANFNRMADKKNEVILSNYDLTYLDIGLAISMGITMESIRIGGRCINLNPEAQT
jgi:hexosaminidase